MLRLALALSLVIAALPARSLAQTSQCGWSALEGPAGNGVNGRVNAMAVYDDGSGEALYVGGQFTMAGDVPAISIAKWDGLDWSLLPTPEGILVNGEVNAMVVHDDGSGRGECLYVAGQFTLFGDMYAPRIARWDGTEWTDLNTGHILGFIYALCVFDDGLGAGPSLYAGGDFNYGYPEFQTIMRWDGSQWRPLAGPAGAMPTNDWVLCMDAFDDGSGPALYVGGHFTVVRGITVNRIARYDGFGWSALAGPVGTGMNSSVQTVRGFPHDVNGGPRLFAGGTFAQAGGIDVSRVAQWNGSQWAALSTPAGVGLPSHALSLGSFDDGTGNGPAMYVGGWFPFAGDVEVNGIARWDGTGWSALPGETEIGLPGGSVRCMQVWDDGLTDLGPALYVGGTITNAGGIPVSNIARWRNCTEQPCLPDLNGDGSVNFFDVQLFLNYYATGNLAADFNDDGALNFFDVQIFLNEYSAGCP